MCDVWGSEIFFFQNKTKKKAEIRLPTIVGQFPENNWQHNELRK
jgi:hypothetical protein